MEKRSTLNRATRYLPLLFWLALISFASTAEFSSDNTSRIIGPLVLWLFPRISNETLNSIHFLVRKAAHFTEYGILAWLAARAFAGSAKTILRTHWFLLSLALVAIYSLFDEYHQSFVPTRTASIYDSMIDTTGGVVVLLLLFLLQKWRSQPLTRQLR